jgi:hypothetical protein
MTFLFYTIFAVAAIPLRFTNYNCCKKRYTPTTSYFCEETTYDKNNTDFVRAKIDYIPTLN